jgi:hypothetical protein
VTTTPIPPCWSRAEIQNAAQVDAGGLEFADDASDAVFNAVHQIVPLARLGEGRQEQPVTEDDVLEDICQQLNSNEPLIRFITGKVGTGKSHLVRWLATAVPSSDRWHRVYIEKRDTSLRRIIEQILAGIDTAAANSLRASLSHAATQVATVPEAMLAVLNQLHQMVEFDDAPVIAGQSGADLAESREYAARLLGDFTFKKQLSVAGGPIERIVKLAMNGHGADADVRPEDLRFDQTDLRVDPDAFADVGSEFLTKIRSLVSSQLRRTEVAAIIDYYMPRATAAVVTGGGTDLVSAFADVRRELARRGKELFLFVEDLVLLHGIDGHLAQALTVPARRDLCGIRAVIAVTTGHLDSRYDTFADRGVHYTMDVRREDINLGDLRTFVGRYLNVGRVGRTELATAARLGMGTPNKCTDFYGRGDGPAQPCPFVDRCHQTFGTTAEGHGLFPFNASAVDRLIQLASPNGFSPRNILRRVVREPLAVAEAELATPGRFPSARFAALLAPTRTAVPIVIRDTIAKMSANAEAEISLRAFYAANPPSIDTGLEAVAAIFGVQLTDLGDDAATPETIAPQLTTVVSTTTVDAWAAGKILPRDDAAKIRRWMIDALHVRLLNHPHGLAVSRSLNVIRIASTDINLRHVVVENGAGGGEEPAELAIRFTQGDADAVLLKGILSAGRDDLVGPNAGRWFFDLQARLAAWEQEIVDYATPQPVGQIEAALTVLGVLSSVDDRPRTTPAEAIAVMIRPSRPPDLHPEIKSFLTHDRVEKQRADALTVVRDRLTQRKSTGDPSIFDAGAVLRELLPASRKNEIPATGAGVDTLMWRTVQDRQTAAAAAAWAPVKKALNAIIGQVAPSEDFAETIQAMDRFVDRANRAGIFRDPDASQQYRLLRTGMTTANIARLRQLLKYQDATVSPADLWQLAHDPTQMLSDMAAFWKLCNSLLASARTPEQSSSQSTDVNSRVRLHNALRVLADRLEGQAKR